MFRQTAVKYIGIFNVDKFDLLSMVEVWCGIISQTILNKSDWLHHWSPHLSEFICYVNSYYTFVKFFVLFLLILFYTFISVYIHIFNFCFIAQFMGTFLLCFEIILLCFEIILLCLETILVCFCVHYLNHYLMYMFVVGVSEPLGRPDAVYISCFQVNIYVTIYIHLSILRIFVFCYILLWRCGNILFILSIPLLLSTCFVSFISIVIYVYGSG